MLSMVEVNQMLKDNFQRQLQEVKELPEDMARSYKAWVQGLVKTASERMMTAQMPPQQEQPEQEGK